MWTPIPEDAALLLQIQWQCRSGSEYETAQRPDPRQNRRCQAENPPAGLSEFAAEQLGFRARRGERDADPCGGFGDAAGDLEQAQAQRPQPRAGLTSPTSAPP